MKQSAKIYLNPDAKNIITRVVLSLDGCDTEPLPMECHRSDLQNLLFGQPPQLFFTVGVNRDILMCYRAGVESLLYINEGHRPFVVADGQMNCITVGPHSTRRVSPVSSVPPDWTVACEEQTPSKTTVLAGEYFSREILWERTLRGMTVCCEGTLHEWKSQWEQPAFWMRGKPVTPQQALEIIRRTDSVFDCRTIEGVPERLMSVREFLPLHCLQSYWFSPLHFGWCRPDGRIGVDSSLEGNPGGRELVLDGIRLLDAFPFLDLIVLIWNGRDDWEFQPMQLETEGMPSIACGMHLHDGTVELLEAKSAWERFCRYQNLYGEDPLCYWDGYNAKTGTVLADERYLDSCLAANGVDLPKQRKWKTGKMVDVSDQSWSAINLRYQKLREVCGEEKR